MQVDGGSEFAAGFEQACQQLGFRLFVLPPRSPKLNGHVERAHRTHTEEFHEITQPIGASPPSTASCAFGSASTTPSALIRRSATALRWSSLRNSSGVPQPTDPVLDEYSILTAQLQGIMMQSCGRP